MGVFNLHNPWAFTFGILGNIISIFVYFAPLGTFIRIYKEKSTLGFQCLPYMVALFSAMLWMYYAFLKPNALLLISINSFGCVIEAIYIFIFLLYASKKAKKDTVKVLGVLNVGLFSLIFLFTYFPIKDSARVQVVGWICVAVSVSVFAAPLSIVFQVVRTKSVEFMPFTLSFFLTLSAVVWFCYGFLQKDLPVALPNVLGFLLGIIQMVLYGMYRNPKAVVVEDEKKVVVDIGIGILHGRAADVHPLDSPKGVEDVENKQLQHQQNEEQDKMETNYVDDDDDEVNQDNKANVQINPPPILVVCAA